MTPAPKVVECICPVAALRWRGCGFAVALRQHRGNATVTFRWPYGSPAVALRQHRGGATATLRWRCGGMAMVLRRHRGRAVMWPQKTGGNGKDATKHVAPRGGGEIFRGVRRIVSCRGQLRAREVVSLQLSGRDRLRRYDGTRRRSRAGDVTPAWRSTLGGEEAWPDAAGSTQAGTSTTS